MTGSLQRGGRDIALRAEDSLDFVATYSWPYNPTYIWGNLQKAELDGLEVGEEA